MRASDALRKLFPACAGVISSLADAQPPKKRRPPATGTTGGLLFPAWTILLVRRYCNTRKWLFSTLYVTNNCSPHVRGVFLKLMVIDPCRLIMTGSIPHNLFGFAHQFDMFLVERNPNFKEMGDTFLLHCRNVLLFFYLRQRLLGRAF